MRPACLLLTFGLFTGCASGGAKYKIDDIALAQVPIGEKQAIFAAENDISVARSSEQKAIADRDAVGSEIEIADKEFDQARLEVQKVQIERDAAQKAQDQNRVAAAEKQRQIAASGERMVSARLDWLRKKKRHQQALVDAAAAHVSAAQAKVELEKARLAAAKNIKPTADFAIDPFSQQYLRREQSLAGARKLAETRGADAEQAQKKHEAAKAEYANLRAPPPAK